MSATTQISPEELIELVGTAKYIAACDPSRESHDWRPETMRRQGSLA